MSFSEHIINFFNEFGLYTKTFSNDLFDKSLWFPILITLLSVYLLIIILSKFNFISEYGNKIFIIAKGYIISCMLVASVLIAIATYSWSIDFKGYFDLSFRFVFIISLSLVFILAFIKYLKLRNYYTRNTLKNITVQPVTALQENTIYMVLKRAFDKFKLWLILPILGFIFLFSVKENKTLISIIIDASGSMTDGRLDAGKEGLKKTLQGINSITTDYIISVTPHQEEDECPEYITLSEILQQTNPERFCSYTAAPFSGELPIDFINNISPYEGINSDHAHVLFALWQNYLIAKQFVDDNQKEYQDKIMLVVSDFHDRDLGNALNTFFDTNICNDTYGYSEFYSDKAFIINLNEKRETFVSKFEDCYPNAIYDGYNIEEYSNAIEDIFGDVQSKTWYFVIWLGVLYLLFLILFFSVNPKKIHES